MNPICRMFLFSGTLLALGIKASGATNALPQLQVRPSGPAAAELSWPASAKDMVLEEAFDLSSGSFWQVSERPATLGGDWFSVRVNLTGASRFFRLRYRPGSLLSTNPAIEYALIGPGSTNVVAGQPFGIQVRASFNAVLAVTSFRVAASGAAGATLTSRSANPGQNNGLVFLSPTSQQPFANGLPADLKDGGALEVLLGTGPWPFDGVEPGEEVLLERLEVTPSGSGELTISLAAAQAVTSRWAQDGLFFASASLNPWRSSVTVQVQPAAVAPGTSENVPLRGSAQAGGERAIRLAGPLLAIDANVDGQGAVDLADLVFVRARLGTDASLPENKSADVDRSSKIDLLDLVAVRNRLTLPPSEPSQAVKINEVAPNPGPGQAPWVELNYSAAAATAVSGLALRNGAQQLLLSADDDEQSIELQPGWFLLAVFDGEKPSEFLGSPEAPTGLKIHLANPGNAFNSTNDQCLLYRYGELVDSVAWGNQPERNNVLNTGIFPIAPGGSIGRDGYEKERWGRFAQPTPGTDNGLPTPLASFPFDGAGVLKAETTRFSWVDPRYSPVAYELEVDDADDFQTPLFRVACYEPGYTHSPGLPTGKFFWRLRAQAGEVTGPWSTPAGFEVMDLPPVSPQARVTAQSVPPRPTAPPALPSTFVIPWFEQNKVLGPRKDTTMVCMECDQQTGVHPWDKPHGTPEEVRASSVGICVHEIGHAATAIAATVNHFYGGSLTQDELNFDVFTGGASSAPEGNLGHGALASLAETLPAALGTKVADDFPSGADWQVDEFYDGLKQRISRGTPAAGMIWVKQANSWGKSIGPVVIYGYMQAKDLSGKDTILLIAAGPFIAQGTVIPRNSIDSVYVYWPWPSAASVSAEESDPDLGRDTDGDGLCDLDELTRFATNERKPDSDADGIEDKTEVWSYKFGKGWVARTPDPDGDGERAETDSDTDGDGCPDGEEDRNHDGTLLSKVVYVYTDTGSFPIGGGPDDKETDPFSLDEFKVTLTSGRTTLRFKECTRLEVKVTDKAGRPVKDTYVEFKMEPWIGSFDASEGPPVTTALELTDKDGKASMDFCAQETEGTVTVEALYQPCPKGKENKAELKIKILPYDWIFAVQEEAVLDGPRVVTCQPILLTENQSISSQGASQGCNAAKDKLLQTARGHFSHPESETPGKYIKSISVLAGGGPKDIITLRIDGKAVPGGMWQRSAPDESPSRWEVQIQLETIYSTPPRSLELTTLDRRTRSTPLVWWLNCSSYIDRQRTYIRYRWSLVDRKNIYCLLKREWRAQTAQFFFGDGSPNGIEWPYPPGWPGNPHTQVSFIPRVSIMGLSEGQRQTFGLNPEQTDWGKALGGEYQGEPSDYAVFSSDKNTCLTTFHPWTGTSGVCDPDCPTLDLKAELEALGPPQPLPFLDGFEFERDYIGAELKEIQERKIDAPQYRIKMKLGTL